MADRSRSPLPGRKKKTLALYSSFLALGLAASVYGPTLVSMEYLLDADTKSLSFGYSGNALGYLAGAVFCGFVYAPINKELLFTLALYGIGLATFLTPHSLDVYFFVVSYLVQGFFMAVIDTAGQSYALKLWQGTKFKDPIMQGAHAVWSVGSTAGPFLVRPFLVDIKEFDLLKNNSANVMKYDLNQTKDLNMTYLLDAPVLLSKQEVSNSSMPPILDFGNYTAKGPDHQPPGIDGLLKEQRDKVMIVMFAFGLIAFVVVLCAIMFCCVLFCHGATCRDRYHQQNKKRRKLTLPKSYRSFRFTLLVFMFFFYFTYLWVEAIPGAFMAAFVVKGLGWPNNLGAVITSAYWCSHGFGRLTGIPLATCMSPRNMLIVDLALLTFGFALMIFIPFYEIMVWVGIVIAGLGMGTVFPSAILWLEEYMEITGAASSVLLAAASLGGIVGPLLTGYLFDEIGHMCVVHVIFTASLVEILIFTAANFYAENHSSRPKVWRSYTLEVVEPQDIGEDHSESRIEMSSVHVFDQSRTAEENDPLHNGGISNADPTPDINTGIGNMESHSHNLIANSNDHADTEASVNIGEDIEYITPREDNDQHIEHNTTLEDNDQTNTSC